MIDVAYAAELADKGTEVVAAAGPLGAFGVNFKLFFAQLVNFAVVVFVLWRWVYRPLLKIMQERTDKIEQSLADAKKLEEERGTFTAQKEQEMRRLRDEAANFMNEAHEKAERAAHRMKEKTKEDVAEIVAEARTQIARERETMRQELREETLSLAVAVAEKVLQEKFDETKDAALLKNALAKVKNV